MERTPPVLPTHPARNSNSLIAQRFLAAFVKSWQSLQRSNMPGRFLLKAKYNAWLIASGLMPKRPMASWDHHLLSHIPDRQGIFPLAQDARPWFGPASKLNGTKKPKQATCFIEA